MKLKYRRSAKFDVFPALVNTWPILLFVSQKTLVPIGLILGYPLKKKYFAQLSWGLLVLGLGACLLLVQPTNRYQLSHLIGFAGFIVAAPLINLAAYTDKERLYRIISIGGLFNACLAIVIFLFHPHLHGLRGLNFIKNRNGFTTRFFIETTSLLAVTNFSFVRSKVFRYLANAIVLFYVIVLAKSILVILLLLSDRYLIKLLRSSLGTKIAFTVASLTVVVLASLGALIYRPDLLLSVGFKLFELWTISHYLDHLIWGHGWGFVIRSLATSPTEPYQIEMQLPMLVVQVGIVYVTAFLIWIYRLIRSTSRSRLATVARFSAYVIVGFINPWLLLPSWYMTCALLYRNLDVEQRTVLPLTQLVAEEASQMSV